MEAAVGRMRPQPPHAGLGPALPLERAHEVHARRVLLRSEQTGGVFTASTPTAVGGAPREPRSRPGRSAQDRSPELTGPDGGSLPRSLPADRATPSGSDTLARHVWTRRLSKPGALSSAPPPGTARDGRARATVLVASPGEAEAFLKGQKESNHVSKTNCIVSTDETARNPPGT